MASELRPVMPADLFMAAIEGDIDVLIPRLGLQPDEEPTEIDQVPIEDSQSSDPEQLQTVQSELQSVTGFGDTVLHVLVTEQHNGLALKVFQRYRSLLNARNNLSETPLHCAAKVGNKGLISDLINIDPVITKDAIKEKDEHGDTPLHIAAKYGHMFIAGELMGWDKKIAHRVNNEKLFPLHIAIMKNYTKMVIKMLEVDPTLACIPFSDGMFPVHISAHMGNVKLVIHFIKEYPNYAKLLDPRRRNLFHIAAEDNQTDIFTGVFKDTAMGPTAARMNNACDNEGNSPWHIAAMKGHKSIMKAIWENKMGIDAQIIENNEGLTPFKLSKRQLETIEYIDDDDVESYVSDEGWKFTRQWFDDIMIQAPKNKWEKTQVLGLGSVLITTVTFAAAFTIPGGYNQNNGTPVLGMKYMFRAFIVANTLAFSQGFVSLLVLLWGTSNATYGPRLVFASIFFLLAANSMVMAFGLGMYVTLAPICYPIAVLVLVITLFIGSPIGIISSIYIGPQILKSITYRIKNTVYLGSFILFLTTVPFPLIFGLALL